jgi:hypothetical protein
VTAGTPAAVMTRVLTDEVIPRMTMRLMRLASEGLGRHAGIIPTP